MATHGRCFGSGTRNCHAATIAPRNGVVLGTHRWLIKHRDRYAAHLDADSGDEVFRTFVIVDGDEPVGVPHEGERWLAPDRPSQEHLFRLLRYVDLKARQRRDNAAKALYEDVASLPGSPPLRCTERPLSARMTASQSA